MIKYFLMILLFGLLKLSSAQTTNTNGGLSLIPKPTDSEIKKSQELASLPKNIKIPSEWVGLLNPAYEEFWTEGNHKPDAGFVLFARNPSKENAKLWLIRNEVKAKYAKVMMDSIIEAQRELVKEGVILDRYNMVNPPRKINNRNVISALNSGISSSDPDVYFLFSPTCSYCHNLAKNLKILKNVQPLQVTNGEIYNFEGLPESDYATQETIANYAADGAVPVVVFVDNLSKKASVIKGYKTESELVTLLNNFKKGGN